MASSVKRERSVREESLIDDTTWMVTFVVFE
jgi:hypothetical protein